MEEKSFMTEFAWLYAKWKDLSRNDLFNEALDLLNATIESRQDQLSERYKSILISLKGDTYRKMGHYDQAIYQYKQANSIESSDILLSIIAKCYCKMGNFEQAEIEIAKVTMTPVIKNYEYWKKRIIDREGR